MLNQVVLTGNLGDDASSHYTPEGLAITHFNIAFKSSAKKKDANWIKVSCFGKLAEVDIGTDEVEVTLLGDTINLAARLEKNCQRDNILVDNRTKGKASKEDADYVNALPLTQVQIPPSEAKGQQFTIRAWTKNDQELEG